MSVSLIQFSYKPEVVGKLIKNPEDRSLAVKALLEKAGRKMLTFYYCFGDYDGIIIAEMPDYVSGLAATMAAFSQNLKTTVLITVEDAMEAMKKASGLEMANPKG
jgi:uncharacterized protein with GYD domain